MSGPPVRVGVNLLWLVPGVVGGSEEYTVRLLRGVARSAPADLHLTLFVLDGFAAAHPDLAATFATVTCPIRGGNRVARVAAEATWLARQARRRAIDLLHHAGGVVPPGAPLLHIPSVLTIHDLQPLLMPDNFSTVKRRWLGAMLPRSARSARLVLTPSDPAAASIVELLGVPADRVLTVPHGVETPDPVPADALARTRRRYRLEGRSILYPAIPYRHKDHATLVAAFAVLAAERPDVTLMLAGGPGPVEGELAAAIRASGVGERVRRPGRVPWADLHALYGLASVVAVPSRFEGFGAPALEAMAAGVPVVVADATALPWVVGPAGRRVAPGDVTAWAAALGEVLDVPAVADELAQASRERAAHFTWARASDALLAGYRRALGVGETGAT